MYNARVAILGCSHSSAEQFMSDANNLEWAQYMANRFPNVKFDNYSNLGKGPLYYDMTLKYILANKPTGYYDTVVIQYTVENRWLLGIEPSTSDIMCAEYEERKHTENYSVMYLCYPHLVLTAPGALAYDTNHAMPTANTDTVSERRSKRYQKIKGDVYGAFHKQDSLATMYDRLFYTTTELLYKDKFNKLFTWDFYNGYRPECGVTENRTNMNLSKNFIQWATAKYGEDFIIDEMLDDSLHCTAIGNEILAHEYLRDTEMMKHFEMLNQGMSVNHRIEHDE